MSQATVPAGTQSVDGAATTSSEAAQRRLDTFQRALARTLQAAHLETAPELTTGEGG